MAKHGTGKRSSKKESISRGSKGRCHKHTANARAGQKGFGWGESTKGGVTGEQWEQRCLGENDVITGWF